MLLRMSGLWIDQETTVETVCTDWYILSHMAACLEDTVSLQVSKTCAYTFVMSPDRCVQTGSVRKSSTGKVETVSATVAQTSQQRMCMCCLVIKLLLKSSPSLCSFLV